MTRPCLRCHCPLFVDPGVIEDARRTGKALSAIPLRCIHGHTERLPLAPERRTHLVPTCGYCEQPVLERKRDGKTGVLNHPACVTGLGGSKPHRFVEVEVEQPSRVAPGRHA